MAKKYVAQVALQRPPESNWLCPTSFPDLRGRGAKRFGIDIESKDPRLTTDGPGWMRGDAKVIGVAIAVDGWKRYYPCGHDAPGHQQVARNVLSAWLNEQLIGDEEKIGANLPYDLAGLSIDLGVKVNGPIIDIQCAEALLEEDSLAGYSLQVLGNKYLGQPKNEEMLLQACEAFGLGKIQKGVRKKYKDKMYLLPPKYVGPYAEEDAAMPLEIWDKQLPLLRADELMRVWELERKITPLLVEMYRQGVRVDTDRAEQVSLVLRAEEKVLQRELDEMAGFPVSIGSSPDLKKVFDTFKVYYPFTPAGNPSFTREFLESCDEFPFAAKLVELRQKEKIRRDFIEGAILEKNSRGRIHATFCQLRQDDSGTRSGRFSCVNPNLTQIPSRHEIYGPMVRSIFIPEDGCQWVKCDSSQQEFRISVSFGHLLKFTGAAEARRKYIEDPNTDFHALVGEMTGLPRKDAKAVNLACSYQLGKKKFAVKTGITQELADEIYGKYHAGVPFIKQLNSYADTLAQERGWVKTVLGRRSRFNLWEPAFRNKDQEEYTAALPLHKAREKWGDKRLKRAHTFKAFNRVVQGSAADALKTAMLWLFRAGVRVPLCVHDELNSSWNDIKTVKLIKEAMEEAIEFAVPMKAEPEVGRSWGELSKIDLVAA